MSLVYEPVPSVTPFLLSNAFQSFIVGPVGSTKTTASLVKILLEAKRVAACPDGIRRSKTAVVRNTRQILLDTTIPDFLKLFPEGEAGWYQRTELKFTIKMDDVECEVLFRGLDDGQDVRRLLSLQLTNAMLDEVREINPDVFAQLTTRLGRYPNGLMVPHRPEWGVDAKGNPIQGCVDDNGKPMKRVWGATNPADQDSFWGNYLSDPPENSHVTIQPSGRSPEADWLKHLPVDYYEDMMQGKTEDWISVYVDGEWGKSLSGQPVFKSFHRDTHVSKAPLAVLPSSSPLLIGVDAGLTPAAVIGAVGYDGRVLGYNALVSDNMGALRFIREKLKPLLATKFPGRSTIVIIDPAAFQRAQTDERTVADIYKSEGFMIKPAKTNSVTARLSAVDKYLTRTVDGKSGLLLCPEGCAPLVTALAGKYRYKVNAKGEKDETPEKSHPWSDVSDAFEYLCLHADGGELFGGQHSQQRREVKPSPMRWAVGC
jgi:hypothetical protein